MKLFAFRFVGIFVFAVLSCTAWAQVPEDIITESTQPEDDEFIDGVVKHTLRYEARLLPYAPVREADVPWERRMWRIIDVREKLNLPFVYPTRPLVTIMTEGIESGELVAFHKDDFKDQMTKVEVDQKLFSIDTVPIVDPETYETTIEVTKSVLDAQDIKRFRIKEIWFFDENTSRVKNRVLGIAPIKAEYDDAGNFKYEGPMFWIYYPQAREFFSKQRAFVDGNDASPVTWETIFEMRKFSSYIIEATNVMDKRLQDYAQYKDNPLELLYEGERIKQELFNFEHDLWSY